eukprot:m.116061 g.116061  ORF g.116061 m.116061 type:complete len:60 (+) comp9179_c0_seq5:3706-3885(+)
MILLSMFLRRNESSFTMPISFCLVTFRCSRSEEEPEASNMKYLIALAVLVFLLACYFAF